MTTLRPDIRRDAAWARLCELLRRFCRADDLTLSDDALVRAVVKRYDADRALPIIDVGE